jgi:hypothetical protein
MNQVLSSFLLLGCLFGGPPAVKGQGYLYQSAYALDFERREPAEPYLPQPGDIMLTTDELLFWKITFNLAFAGHPHHSGILVARSNGKLAVLEAGPHDTTHIELLDVEENLCQYEKEGRVWIRRRRKPLTAEESAKLTQFAEEQERKPFALIRLAGQLTVFRSRGCSVENLESAAALDASNVL